MDKHLVAVWRSARATGLAKFLLTVLAANADENGVSTASNDELASAMGVSARLVRSLLRQLESAGDIAYLYRGGGKRGDRRRIGLCEHLCVDHDLRVSAQPPAPQHSHDTVIMPMRNMAPGAMLNTASRLQRLRALQMLGVAR